MYHVVYVGPLMPQFGCVISSWPTREAAEAACLRDCMVCGPGNPLL